MLEFEVSQEDVDLLLCGKLKYTNIYDCPMARAIKRKTSEFASIDSAYALIGNRSYTLDSRGKLISDHLADTVQPPILKFGLVGLE